MFRHFRERLAFTIAPWTRPSTVVERVVQHINVYPPPNTTAADVVKAINLKMKVTP